jgi:hypothetical protein
MVVETRSGWKTADTAILSAADTAILDRETLIRNAVQLKTSGRIRGLRVALSNGRLIISGYAATYYSKQLATHAALDVAGTLVIQNDVIVTAG